MTTSKYLNSNRHIAITLHASLEVQSFLDSVAKYQLERSGGLPSARTMDFMALRALKSGCKCSECGTQEVYFRERGKGANSGNKAVRSNLEFDHLTPRNGDQKQIVTKLSGASALAQAMRSDVKLVCINCHEKRDGRRTTK